MKSILRQGVGSRALKRPGAASRNSRSSGVSANWLIGGQGEFVVGRFANGRVDSVTRTDTEQAGRTHRERIDEREVSKEARASFPSHLNGRRANNDRDANRGCAE